MEEQTTWKGHGFTLFVFTGIVVLCSIFFILGMLVGRSQGQKIASVAAAAGPAEKDSSKAGAKDEKSELTFYESAIEKERPPALEAPVAKPEPAAPDPPKQPEAAPAPPPNAVYYQISALRKPSEAEKLLDELRGKGFRAFILAPPVGDPNPYFRVRVGPFGDVVEADQSKKKLETAGYEPILIK